MRQDQKFKSTGLQRVLEAGVGSMTLVACLCVISFSVHSLTGVFSQYA